ncbi:MAG: hypothetical protein ACRYFZ_07845 [Janthinobacterium lividum]
MKKITLLIGICAALPTLAQTQPSAGLPVGVSVTRRVIRADTPPEQLADERASRLASQLGLSPEQTAKVRAAELARAQARQARLRQLEASHARGIIKPGPEDKAIEDNFEAQLKAICTPAQYEHHQTMKARFRRLSARADSLRLASPAPSQPK